MEIVEKPNPQKLMLTIESNLNFMFCDLRNIDKVNNMKFDTINFSYKISKENVSIELQKEVIKRAYKLVFNEMVKYRKDKKDIYGISIDDDLFNDNKILLVSGDIEQNPNNSRTANKTAGLTDCSYQNEDYVTACSDEKFKIEACEFLIGCNCPIQDLFTKSFGYSNSEMFKSTSPSWLASDIQGEVARLANTISNIPANNGYGRSWNGCDRVSINLKPEIYVSTNPSDPNMFYHSANVAYTVGYALYTNPPTLDQCVFF